MNNISQIWAQPAQQDFGTPQPARPAKFRCKIPSTFDECQKDAAFHGLWPVKKALFQGFYQTSDEYLSSPLLRTPTKWSIDLKNCSLFHPADIHSDLFFVVKYKTRMTMFIVQLNWHPAVAQLNMEKKIYEIYEMKVQPDRHGGDGTVRLNGAGSWRVGQVICDKD